VNLPLPADPGAEPDAAAFLGVERSLGGRLWRLRPLDDRVARTLAQRHDLPEVVARVMAGRGVGLDDAAGWLDPTLKALLPDPSVLVDMDRAAERLARAVRDGEQVAIFGDYDVDGATSTALLVRWLRQLGLDPLVHIPDRIKEGYGPNAPALRALAERGARLVIAVDTGTTAFEPLAAAAEAGLDVIVLDHHTAEARLPPALAVVNPNRLDQAPGLGQLAACGVTFLTLVAVNRALRAGGGAPGGREPDLIGLLDLVALGTVCDVVPLTGLNRALVGQGLKVAQRRRNPGLRALADSARVAERLDAWHLGFLIGPRINAAGRIGRADLGARLLSTDDATEALQLATMLEGHNDDRKEIEAAVLADATARVEAAGTAGPGGAPVIVVAGQGWHPGVIGIVAGRLKERYNRPVCVVALEGGVGKASGRSIPAVDLGTAVIEARRAGLLIAGGGHRMAAGFTVAEDRLPALATFLAEHADGQTGGPPVPVLDVDGALAPGGAGLELAQTLEGLGPWGAGNPEPKFVLSNARPVHADVVGDGHVRCVLSGSDGGRLKAIAFRCVGEPLGDALLARTGAPMHVAGQLRVNRWQGREEAQFRIDDAAPVAG
jgi:single-stranded-DNA-specific exonuclease